ncbi:MAG: hypothetical protein CO129_04830 [Ignavibacteriales bacterium CG_4_9_14_3_um_filter_34_10]|nr:MAG: hypothetical protein CO129_04830 [Ignavibacteriales bacterium CG_4_9_14_3_um_filter_34_10]
MTTENFEEPIYREINPESNKNSGNVIKQSEVEIVGKTKISVEEESLGGVKFVIKKDENDNIKEIKFICSCGQTKSLILDYSE